MTNIEKNVMRRVHTIHTLRPLVSGGALAFVLAGLALVGIGKEVWVARVLENAPHTFALLPQFYLSAFTHTDIVVQALSVVALASVIYLARETAKLVSNIFIPVRA